MASNSADAQTPKEWKIELPARPANLLAEKANPAEPEANNRELSQIDEELTKQSASPDAPNTTAPPASPDDPDAMDMSPDTPNPPPTATKTLAQRKNASRRRRRKARREECAGSASSSSSSFEVEHRTPRG
ncbi:uncharacterized protein BDZ99DRAFT_524496 [Mytilinidion resinicola]|uniref:Uncharacterized protein n=1 Tax=Mytilinidion resinicola TaxID=574789 RepID=A0A6A6Y9N4_9PEZI|nr:uncharacterized protein BDZ99DRAFT_524496 [Mytilinidion resinicola]KAF2805526.1 hypothetical protein BDZ99DRAFT_524496 [Mytilinidion resinicola]